MVSGFRGCVPPKHVLTFQKEPTEARDASKIPGFGAASRVVDLSITSR